MGYALGLRGVNLESKTAPAMNPTNAGKINVRIPGHRDQ